MAERPARLSQEDKESHLRVFGQVVWLHAASVIEHAGDDDNDGDITVFETVLPKPPKEEVPTEPLDPVVDITRLLFAPPLWDEDDREDDEPPTYSTPTLRLDLKSVIVLDIKAVQYTRHRRVVSRHRSTKSEGRDS